MTKDLSRESIQKTSRNFTAARILLTGVDLDLFSMLASEKLSAARIASRLEFGSQGNHLAPGCPDRCWAIW